jgi:hypothetical protein
LAIVGCPRSSHPRCSCTRSGNETGMRRCFSRLTQRRMMTHSNRFSEHSEIMTMTMKRRDPKIHWDFEVLKTRMKRHFYRNESRPEPRHQRHEPFPSPTWVSADFRPSQKPHIQPSLRLHLNDSAAKWESPTLLPIQVLFRFSPNHRLNDCALEGIQIIECLQ